MVHPKIKILSFTHPQVFPNLYEIVSSAEHKRRGGPINCLVTNILQNIFFCVQKKEILETMRVSK